MSEKTKVVIVMEEGVIENVYADANLEYLVLDVGTDGLSEDEIMTVEDIDGSKVDCYKYFYPINRQDQNGCDTEIVEHFFKQVEAIEEKEVKQWQEQGAGI